MPMSFGSGGGLLEEMTAMGASSCLPVWVDVRGCRRWCWPGYGAPRAKACSDPRRPRAAMARGAQWVRNLGTLQATWPSLLVLQHPGVLCSAALTGVHHQRAFTQGHAGEAARREAYPLAHEHERAQVEMALGDAGVHQRRAG